MSQQMFKVKPVQHYEGPRYLAAPIEQPRDEAPIEEETVSPLVVFLSIVVVLIIMFGLSGCYLRHQYNPDTEPDTGPDGDPPDDDCDPGHILCADEWTLQICVDGTPDLQSCDDYCFEVYGYDYYSMGCNDDAADPCRCEYGIIDGVDVECTPGDVRCVDEYTIEHCQDWWIETQSCHDWCQEHYGWEYTSWGCNEDAGEVCGCTVPIR